MIHSINDATTLRAFNMLNAEELKPARDFIRQEFQRTLDILVTAPADQIGQLQGRARALRDILEVVGNAATKLGGA